MAQRTVLYQAHLSAGAKMVDFAGWEMPIHYGSQLAEHHAVRASAGLFDVSHMCALDLAGPAAAPFLRGLLANDVARLGADGRALYSCMLNEAGGVVDDLIVYRLGPTRFRLVVNAGTAEKDIAWMRPRLPAAGVDFALRRDLAMIALQGPRAAEVLAAALPAAAAAAPGAAFRAAEAGAWLVARTGYTGEDGFELALPAAEAESAWAALTAAGAAPCGLGARDTLRLEAGMCLYGQDLDEDTSPLESGLAWTVDLSDPARDFSGRRALAAKPPRCLLTGLVLEDRGVLRAHQRVFTPRGEGHTTSGSVGPTVGASIALARLPLGTAPGDPVEVEIRDRRLAARVVQPPFVRRGQILINRSSS